jgi:tetratricopeptide (TPR) repeat protein
MRRWWLRLAVALCAWYAAQDRLDAWATICQTVLDSPLARQRAAVAGWAHNERGAIFRLRGEPHRAADELALAVTRRHRRGAAQSRTNLGLALLDQHDVDGALDQLQRARRQRSPADRAGQALTELGLGAAFLARNEPALARRHLILAANRFDAVGDRRGYAAALTNLVIAQWWLGEHLDAAHAWSAALEHYERAGDTRGHAVALLNAGAAMARGDRRRALRAREVLLESLRLRQGTPLPSGRVLLNLGDAAETLGETDEARRYWSGAADACHLERDDDGAEWAARRLARTEATSGT